MGGRYWCLFNKKYYITEKSLFLYQVYLGRGWEERKLLFFFLEKQKQAVLLTVIDKAGRKKIYEIYFEVDKYRYKINLNRNSLS